MKTLKRNFITRLLAIMLAAVFSITVISPIEVVAAKTSATAVNASNQLFDANYYATAYPDLKALYGNDANLLFKHYMSHGIYEGRNASAGFNALFYKAANPDVAMVYGDDLSRYAVHYMTYGIAEGRRAVGANAIVSVNPNILLTTLSGNELENLLILVNTERAKVNAQPLTYDATLERVARLRVSEVKTNFSHTRPDKTDCFTAFTQLGAEGFGYEWRGENLATGYNDAASVFKAWTDSPTHKANILRPEFNKVGFAKDGLYWVQAFGG